MEKIVVYGPDVYAAARLAASMNLALRQWEYKYERFVWADVGGMMDRWNEQHKEEK